MLHDKIDVTFCAFAFVYVVDCFVGVWYPFHQFSWLRSGVIVLEQSGMCHSLLIGSVHPWRTVIPFSLTVTPVTLNVTLQPTLYSSQMAIRLFCRVGALYAILAAEGIPFNSNCSVLVVCIVCPLGDLSVFMSCQMSLHMAKALGFIWRPQSLAMPFDLNQMGLHSQGLPFG